MAEIAGVAMVNCNGNKTVGVVEVRMGVERSQIQSFGEIHELGSLVRATIHPFQSFEGN